MPAEIRGPSSNSPNAWPTGSSPSRLIPLDLLSRRLLQIRHPPGRHRTPSLTNSLKARESSLSPEIPRCATVCQRFSSLREHCNNVRHAKTPQLARKQESSTDETGTLRNRSQEWDAGSKAEQTVVNDAVGGGPGGIAVPAPVPQFARLC